MCYTRRKIQGGVGALRESDDTNYLKPNGQSRNLNIYDKDTALQSSDDRIVSILPALVSFGLLNLKDVVASKASNSRLEIFFYIIFTSLLSVYLDEPGLVLSF